MVNAGSVCFCECCECVLVNFGCGECWDCMLGVYAGSVCWECMLW